MILAADVTLPDNSGYVVAAYLVFLALILIYVAIMARRLMRTERDLGELKQEVAAREHAEDDCEGKVRRRAHGRNILSDSPKRRIAHSKPQATSNEGCANDESTLRH